MVSLEQLLSDPQFQTAPQSFSSPRRTPSDSTTISPEAIRLNTTHDTQWRTTAQSSTVNGGHQHDKVQVGPSSIGQSTVSTNPINALCGGTVSKTSSSNSDSFIPQLGGLVTMKLLAAYGQTMTATVASTIVPSMSVVA